MTKSKRYLVVVPLNEEKIFIEANVPTRGEAEIEAERRKGRVAIFSSTYLGVGMATGTFNIEDIEYLKEG